MSFFTGGRRQQQETPIQSTPPTSNTSTISAPSAPRQPVGFETVLGANSTLRGELRSQANVRLDGTFEGTLEIEGNVLVGETGKVTADINARNVVIAGAVRGNVSGNKVQLLKTSRVWGDISAAAITTEEGAFIDGKITMVRHDASMQSFEPASLPQPGTPPPAPVEVKEEKSEVAPPETPEEKTPPKAEKSEEEDIEVVVGEAVEDD
jgi:cytoskeletal protein CcmA (bactofilin family)